jgi:hypothetical protein
MKGMAFWESTHEKNAPKQPALSGLRPDDVREWSRDGAKPKRARFLPRLPDRRNRFSRVNIMPPHRMPPWADRRPPFVSG